MKQEYSRMVCKTNEEFWQEISKVWDYEKNEKHWSEYTKGSHRYIWIRCEEKDYHGSYQARCDKFSIGQRCPYCNSNSGKVHILDSFAQYHINNTDKDFLNKYWDYEKNTVDPWKITPSSNKHNIWIKCQEKHYHKSYYVNCSDFTVGQNRCPYCFNKKIHILDSFAQWGIDNVDKDFLEKYWDYEKNNDIDPYNIPPNSHEKVWIKCQRTNYHGSYEISLGDFVRGRRCPYCNSNSGKVHPKDSLGTLYPKVLEIWSDKNKKSSYEYTPYARKEVWWKCLNEHEDYKRKISTSNRFDFRCPECVRERKESFLQEKVRLYLNKLGYESLHENNCSIVLRNPKTNQPLPFDNEVVELKLIIEVHGQQHYDIIGFHKMSAKRNNTTPEYELHYQKLKDRYKRIYAKSKGYNYLEIPYWTDDKDETWKKLIDNKIKEIKNK